MTCPEGHRWEAVGDEASDLGRHPAICPVCSSPAATEEDFAAPEMVDELPPRPKPVPEVAVTLQEPDRLQETRDAGWPTLKDYEILGELGRGGMGVVYQASQQSLKRVVALKVLAEAHAASERVRLFRREAEAAARLQHPHIVQIHQVGEQDGRPYLVLESVEGGSLAGRIAGIPWPVTQAARIVETLARAIHYAHQRGIVHRDLKPANVLLTIDGVPKITDFGLAKLLDTEVGQTKLGVIMGTPSYMAPEQARGQAQEIGPATDVYALGTILYELLTGRPPFRGATTLETVHQVLFDELVAPTRLQPRVPRDLETICLKCLQKEPQKRYPSAQTLAEDLRRFLAGEPILARPVSWLERLARWCWRNPRVAGLLATLVTVFAGGFALVTWQWLRAEDLRILAQQQRNEAERNYQLARGVVADYFASFNRDAQLDPAGALPLRKELLETALGHFQSFLQERGEDPDLQTALATAHYCLGQIAYLTGHDSDALPRYEKALAIQQELVAQQPGSIVFQRDLARTHAALGVLHRQKAQWSEARRHNRQAFDIRERLCRENPSDPELRRELIHSYQCTGFLHHASGEHTRALPFLQQARAQREQLIRDYPANLPYQSDLSGTLNDLGLVLETLNRNEEALEVYRQAIQLQQPVFSQARQVIRYRQLLSIHHFNMGRVLSALGRSAEAAEAARVCRQLNPEDPDSLWFAARVLAMAANAVGQGKSKLSANAEAERRRYADQAIQVLQEAVAYGLPDLSHGSRNWAPPEFGPLAARPDFQKLAKDLEGRTQRTPQRSSGTGLKSSLPH
jgi:tetratricopeptide (TPR) repeat protein